MTYPVTGMRQDEIMEIPVQYIGREQAYFKHQLLRAYLERLIMIVGQHQRTICYVDCFAGPWKSQDDDLEDTSIAVSLNIIRKCRDGLKLKGRDVNFRALFVEEKKKSFRVLDSEEQHSAFFFKQWGGWGADGKKRAKKDHQHNSITHSRWSAVDGYSSTIFINFSGYFEFSSQA